MVLRPFKETRVRLRWLFLSALCLSGCATAPVAGPDAARDLARADPVPLASVELKSDAPLLGTKPIEGQLGPGAPVVSLEQGRSYYRMYRVTPREGALHLRVASYCACFGYGKRVAIPVLYVLDKNGNVIEPLPDGYESSQEGAHGFTPVSVTLDVTVPGSDAAYALVAADNSHMGDSVNKINVANVMQLDIAAVPTGRFDIRYASP
jgi:hypothetical protein